MELTVKQMNNTKGVAILMMLCLHLFNRPYQGLFEPLVFIGRQPLSYYISLFCDCCVAIYCFCSGYGLYIGYTKNKENYNRKNYVRIFKLYINFWIVLLLFAVLLGFIMEKPGYPGNWLKFFLNFTALRTSYSGAWWFFTIYIFLVLTSPLIFKAIEKYNTWIILGISFVIYTAGYIQRIKKPIVLHSDILNWFVKEAALYGNCLLPFVIGVLFYKYKVYSKFVNTIKTLPYTNLLLVLMLAALVAFHALFPSLYLAAFTGTLFILFFNAIEMPESVNSFMQFLSSHSTNLWLIHMFFYMIYFKEIIYFPQNPTLIFIWLVLWSLAASFLVRLINKPIANRVFPNQ